jgi:hypothetical protein
LLFRILWNCGHLEVTTSDLFSGRRASRAVGRGARRVGRLVYVFTVDVHGIANEGGASVAVTGVPLLESVYFQPSLDFFDEPHYAEGGLLSLLSGSETHGRSQMEREW